MSLTDNLRNRRGRPASILDNIDNVRSCRKSIPNAQGELAGARRSTREKLKVSTYAIIPREPMGKKYSDDTNRGWHSRNSRHCAIPRTSLT